MSVNESEYFSVTPSWRTLGHRTTTEANNCNSVDANSLIVIETFLFPTNIIRVSMAAAAIATERGKGRERDG